MSSSTDNDSGPTRRGSGFTNHTPEHLKRVSNKLLKGRLELPINEKKSRNRLLTTIARNPCTVIFGPTGCGKSTQLPQLLHFLLNRNREEGSHITRIAVSQPRRIAAVTLAQRVASEMGCNVGSEVGYHVRFDCTVSKQTIITYLTDGMLLRESLVDPLLSRYDVIVLDECHERSLHTDVLFAVVKGLQNRRRLSNPKSHVSSVGSSHRPLKIVAMSATLQASEWSQYLSTPECPDGAPIVRLSPKRRFESVPLYLESKTIRKGGESHVDLAMLSILQTHIDAPFPGDILCFMTSQDEIETLVRLITEKSQLIPADLPKLEALPLYSALPAHLQARVFEVQSNHQHLYTDDHGSKTNKHLNQHLEDLKNTGKVRRVIIATNIAETSVTIPNIQFVIDSGKVKRRVFNPGTGVDLFEISNISKAEAWQRCGRAGRISDGFCLRLYSEEEFESFDSRMEPEIMRCNLRSVILQLKALGVGSIKELDLLDKPAQERIDEALMTLVMLGALEVSSEEEEGHSLTDLGKQMSVFPLEPMFSRALLSEHSRKHCANEILMIVSVLSVDSVFHTPFQRRSEAKDKHSMFDCRISHIDVLHSDDNDDDADADDGGDETKEDGMLAGDLMTKLCVFREYLQRHQRDKEWCRDHYLNLKTLDKALHVYLQLSELYRQVIDDDSLMIPSVFGESMSMTRINSKHWMMGYEHICRALLEGMFNQIAFLDLSKDNRDHHSSSAKSSSSSSSLINNDGHYLTYNGGLKSDIHPSSVLFGGPKMNRADCVIYTSIVSNPESQRIWIRDCLRITNMDWIDESIAHAQKIQLLVARKIDDRRRKMEEDEMKHAKEAMENNKEELMKSITKERVTKGNGRNESSKHNNHYSKRKRKRNEMERPPHQQSGNQYHHHSKKRRKGRNNHRRKNHSRNHW